jgi:hypothetical protein
MTAYFPGMVKAPYYKVVGFKLVCMGTVGLK